MRYLESQQLEDDLDDSMLGPQDSEDDFYEEDTPLSASYPPALEYLLSGDYLEDNDMEDGNIKQVICTDLSICSSMLSVGAAICLA